MKQETAIRKSPFSWNIMSRLLAAREDVIYIMRLSQGLAAAFADIEAGRVIVGTDAFLAEMKRRHPDV